MNEIIHLIKGYLGYDVLLHFDVGMLYHKKKITKVTISKDGFHFKEIQSMNEFIKEIKQSLSNLYYEHNTLATELDRLNKILGNATTKQKNKAKLMFIETQIKLLKDILTILEGMSGLEELMDMLPIGPIFNKNKYGQWIVKISNLEIGHFIQESGDTNTQFIQRIIKEQGK